MMNFKSVFVLVSLVSFSALGQDFRPNVRALGLERLDYKGTRTEMVGNTIEVIDPLVFWVGTPSVSLVIYADGAGRDSIGAGTCRVEGTPPNRIVVAQFSLPREGRFYALRTIYGKGNDDRNHRYGAYWVVDARWPVLVPKIDRYYYYGQTAYFNFAAGHSNYGLYSYEVREGVNLLFSGQGTVVPIDSIWKMGTTYLGRPIIIRGLYNGSPFLFRNLSTSSVDSSVWQCIVYKPESPEILTAWDNSADFASKKERGLIDSLSTLDLNTKAAFLPPTEFRFAYVSRTPSGIVVTPPQLIGAPSVDFSPPEIFVHSEWSQEDLWLVFRLLPNHDYLRRYSARRPAEATVTISFQDQFFIQNKSFTARVYSSK